MTQARIVALCAFALIAALLVVGYSGGGLVRHAVQTAPAWLAVIAGATGARATKWIALPIFLFWLAIMALVWLYLLGLAHIVTGAFPPLEVAMSIVAAVACLFGIVNAAGAHSRMTWAAGLLTLAVVTALQAGAMWLSLQPHFATDAGFRAWHAEKPAS